VGCRNARAEIRRLDGKKIKKDRDKEDESMPEVALSMIVRNEAQTLRRCLGSVRGTVTEMVIGDTGSTDGTPSIAREYGARVIEIPWDNDFAAARNLALAAVNSDWVLSLDADEMLDFSAGAAISALISAPAAAAYQVSIRNYVLSLEDRVWDRPAQPNDFRLPEARAYPGYVDHENVRLFRRQPEIFFVGRVHESVGPQVEALGLPIGRASFLIHHFGLTADAETRAHKNRFYRELGKRKVVDMPQNAQAHLELGLVELDNFGNLVEALVCFERACELNPRFGVAWFFAGLTQLRRGEHREAVRCLRKAEKCGHATPVVAETMGDSHYNLGEFAASVQAYRQALQRSPESPLLESKLGLALGRTGATEEGLRKMRSAVQQRPDLADLHDRLILLLVWLERMPEAAVAAENKLRTMPGSSPSDFHRAASLWARQGDWARATAMLHVGLQLHAGDPLLNQALAELASREGSGVDQLVTALQNSTVRTFQD
jgi:tetratricopeptide (TPR) repeat protein